MPESVQLSLKLPGSAPLPHSDVCEADVLALLVLGCCEGDCPTLRRLTEDQARFVVAWALSDRQTLGLTGVAEIVGISRRTAYYWRAQAWWSDAETEVLLHLTPKGFQLLYSALAERAADLALKLRFGRAGLDSLGSGERRLIELAVGGTTGPGLRLRVHTPDGTTVDASMGGEAQTDALDDLWSEAIAKEQRERGDCTVGATSEDGTLHGVHEAGTGLGRPLGPAEADPAAAPEAEGTVAADGTTEESPRAAGREAA